MASSDMVIYNFEAMESAMSSFSQVCSELEGLSSSLLACSAKLQSVWKGATSVEFADKLSKLKSNFDVAKEKLDVENKELKRQYDEAVDANVSVDQIIESVPQISMG